MTIWTWPASTIARVIDGDSVVAAMTKDIGFHGVVHFEQRLRLNRINAAPAKTDSGIAATAFVQTWADRGVVNIDTVKAYKYGDEWMAEVTDAAGANLSDDLVTNGLAVYWNGEGPRPGG